MAGNLRDSEESNQLTSNDLCSLELKKLINQATMSSCPYGGHWMESWEQSSL